MSYEGYEQKICKNGHYWRVDCYDPDLDEPCPYCGAEEAWSHGVDQTNDEGYEIPLRIKTDAKMCKCPTCGNSHGIVEPAYYIPTKEEMKEAYITYMLGHGWSTDNLEEVGWL